MITSRLWQCSRRWLRRLFAGRGHGTTKIDSSFYEPRAQKEDAMPQGPSIDDLRAEVNRMLNSLDQGIPIAAIVLFQVNGARESTFVKNADALTEATLKLPGANVFSYHKRQSARPGDPAAHLLYE